MKGHRTAVSAPNKRGPTTERPYTTHPVQCEDVLAQTNEVRTTVTQQLWRSEKRHSPVESSLYVSFKLGENLFDILAIKLTHSCFDTTRHGTVRIQCDHVIINAPLVVVVL